MGGDEMVHGVKALGARPDDPGQSIPGSYSVEGENHLLQVVF